MQRLSSNWVFLLASSALAVLLVGGILGPLLIEGLSPLAGLAAALFYLAAHVLRAARLGLLAVPLLGISARSAALMHLSVAPLTLILPWKLGELVRLHQLWKMSNRPANALVVILVDRMFDAVVLVPLMAWLLIVGPQGAAGLSFFTLTTLSALVPLVALILGPGITASAQQYIVTHHINPRVPDVLQSLDRLRRLLDAGAKVAFRGGGQFALITVMIWFCELGFSWAFIHPEYMGEALRFVAQRLGFSWLDIARAGAMVPVAAGFGLALLIIILPTALRLYLPRRMREPRRAQSRFGFTLGGHRYGL